MNRRSEHSSSRVTYHFAANSRIFIGSLLLAGISMHASWAGKEEVIDPSAPPLFLDQQLEGREEAVAVEWTWMAIQGQQNSYEICVVTPKGWKAAYLCVDGQRARSIADVNPCFTWTFRALPVGKHRISLLVVDSEGRAGVTERDIRIK